MKIKPSKLVISGGRDSLYIYVLHPLAMYFINIIMHYVSLQNAFYYISPTVVALLTLLGIYLLRKFRVIGNVI